MYDSKAKAVISIDTTIDKDQTSLRHPFDRSPKLVLVTGATGAIGPLVVEQLCRVGYQVRVLTRRPLPPGLLPPVVTHHLGDVTDGAAVQQAMVGCSLIVHMAALLHLVNPPPALQPEYERVNVQGTANLIQAAVQHDAQRLLFFSTIAVYGEGQIFAESSPLRPTTYYGQSKQRAEELVLAARRQDGQHIGTVLRLAAVYGARVKGNYQRLLSALARGRFLPIGSGENRRTLIHERDVAAAALLALEHPVAGGQIYNVTDGNFHSLREILFAMSVALGRQPPWFSLPVGPVRWAVDMLEKGMGRIGWQSPIGRATIDKYIEEITVDGQRIQHELGFTPQFNLHQGWQEAVTTLRRAQGQFPACDLQP